MGYKLLVFISKDRLSSIYVNETGDSDYVSLEGNQVIEYSNLQDVDQFLQCIKDNFNIDVFSDIKLSVIILNFEAEQSNINYLFDSFKEVCSINIIDPAILLPTIFPRYSTVDPFNKIDYTLTSFGVKYRLSVDENWNLVCKEKNINVDWNPAIEISLDEYKNILVTGVFLYNEKYFEDLIEEHQFELVKVHAEKQELLDRIAQLENSNQMCELTLQQNVVQDNSENHCEDSAQNSTFSECGLAEQLRNSQENEWVQFENMILGLIKEDIKSRAEKGHTDISADLKDYIEKLDELYIEDYKGCNQEDAELSLNDSQENGIWRNFREQFFMVGNRSYNSGFHFGASPKILNKLTDALISKLEVEGFMISISKEVFWSSDGSGYDPLWTRSGDERPSTLKINISW